MPLITTRNNRIITVEDNERTRCEIWDRMCDGVFQTNR